MTKWNESLREGFEKKIYDEAFKSVHTFIGELTDDMRRAHALDVLQRKKLAPDEYEYDYVQNQWLVIRGLPPIPSKPWPYLFKTLPVHKDDGIHPLRRMFFLLEDRVNGSFKIELENEPWYQPKEKAIAKKIKQFREYLESDERQLAGDDDKAESPKPWMFYSAEPGSPLPRDSCASHGEHNGEYWAVLDNRGRAVCDNASHYAQRITRGDAMAIANADARIAVLQGRLDLATALLRSAVQRNNWGLDPWRETTQAFLDTAADGEPK